jgi:serine protease Do
MRKLVLALCATLLVTLTGCVTTGGGTENQPNLMQFVGDLLDTTGSDFKKLVQDDKLPEARTLFNEKKNYFYKKYVAENKEMPIELKKLSEWHFAATYGNDYDAAIADLKDIKAVGSIEGWPSTKKTLESAKQIANIIARDDLLIVSRISVEKEKLLRNQIDQVGLVFTQGRASAIEATSDSVINNAVIPADYPGDKLTESDYLKSTAFQEMLYQHIVRTAVDGVQQETLNRYENILSGDTKTKITQTLVIDKAKKKWLADGRIDLTELGEIQNLAKQHGTLVGMEDAVKVGYVDLTASSFKNRNVFDFEIDFKKDYGLNLTDAKDDFLGSGNLSSYDYVFVTDLSVAKIFREFKSKRELTSKTQTGSRQDPNPEYVQATTDYQRAMADHQGNQLNNAVENARPCYGAAWACALGGAFDLPPARHTSWK